MLGPGTQRSPLGEVCDPRGVNCCVYPAYDMDTIQETKKLAENYDGKCSCGLMDKAPPSKEEIAGSSPAS
eukprot:5221083-Karenia_brevis.AAC.1